MPSFDSCSNRVDSARAFFNCALVTGTGGNAGGPDWACGDEQPAAKTIKISAAIAMSLVISVESSLANYSCFSARTGSTDAAWRAGIRHAMVEIKARAAKMAT